MNPHSLAPRAGVSRSPSLPPAQEPSDSEAFLLFSVKGHPHTRTRDFIKEPFQPPYPGGPPECPRVSWKPPCCLQHLESCCNSWIWAAEPSTVSFSSHTMCPDIVSQLDWTTSGQKLVLCLPTSLGPIPGKAHKARQLVQMAGRPRGKRSPPLSPSLVLGKHPTRGWGWGVGTVVVVEVLSPTQTSRSC